MKAQIGSIINGSTDKGAKRDGNQDAFNFVQSPDQSRYGTLLIVADGVGGQHDGDYASALTVQETLDKFYACRERGDSVEVSIRAAIEASNQLVHAHGQNINANVSCTVIALILAKGELYTAHVGDARAYRFVNQQLIQLTADHSWVADQVRAGVLTLAEAETHPYRHVITRAVGNKPTIQIEFIHHGRFSGEETLLLCSDGLYTTLTEQAIVDLISSHDPEHLAEALVDQAKSTADDNVTAVTLSIFSQKQADAVAAGPERTIIFESPNEPDVAVVDAQAEEAEPSDLEDPDAVLLDLPADVQSTGQAANDQPDVGQPDRRGGGAWLIGLLLLALILLMAGGIVYLQPALLNGLSGETEMPGVQQESGIVPNEVPAELEPAFLTSTPISLEESSINADE